MEIAINGRFLSQPTTGVQRVAKAFTKSLDRMISSGLLRGITVRLLVQSDANLSDFPLDAIDTVTVRGGRGHAWEQLMLPRHLGNFRLLCLGNTAPADLLLRRKRVAVMLHDLSHQIYPTAYRRSYRIGHSILTPIMLRYAAPIVTVSQSERELLVASYPDIEKRIIVAQNGGWDDTAILPEYRWQFGSKDRFGLYVGSLSSRKNIETVVRMAVRYVRATGRVFKIVGAKGAIISDVALQIPEDARHLVQLLGQVEDRKILENLYRNAAFLLFPSFYEASPLPPIEAMAFGCPVVASNIPSLRERCADAALYCDPRKDDEIFDAVMQIDQNAAIARDFSARGLTQSRLFTWEQQARDVIAAMDNT